MDSLTHQLLEHSEVIPKIQQPQKGLVYLVTTVTIRTHTSCFQHTNKQNKTKN